jgi:hypothetical protein
VDPGFRTSRRDRYGGSGGVDHVFIDEAHYFKNLETPSKMDRVAGIQTGGSERAFDVYMKARYLGEKNPGHGVTFATGTPISNTMVEMYTMQRFLDPEGLRARGVEHFDAWAATFGEVIDSMEISPDGSGLRARSRFARFTNLPELQQMFRAFADVQSAEMLNLPRPTLKGGKPILVASPMSLDQHTLQQSLVERYEKIRSQKIDPRIDNALASGNPSVLTLAEVDAELQRLAILRKNHLDEQYVARLRVKELPQTIEHLSKRITDLHADRQTVQEQSDSGIQVTKHWMPREDLLEALDKRLELLPSKVIAAAPPRSAATKACNSESSCILTAIQMRISKARPLAA